MATNLIGLAQQAALQLSHKIGEDNLDLSVAQLKQKIPALEVLGDDTVALQLYQYDDNAYGGTLRIYRDEEENPQIYDAALNQFEPPFPVEFIDWKIEGYDGIARIAVQEEEFIIKIPVDTDSYIEAIEGEGQPSSQWLSLVPQPGARAFSALEKGVTYELIARQADTATVVDEAGEEIVVAEAAALTELVEMEGGNDALPLKFVIYEWNLVEIDGVTHKQALITKADTADLSDVLEPSA